MFKNIKLKFLIALFLSVTCTGIINASDNASPRRSPTPAGLRNEREIIAFLIAGGYLPPTSNRGYEAVEISPNTLAPDAPTHANSRDVTPFTPEEKAEILKFFRRDQ